jgi:xanthine dehydrogenase accessory factor
MASIILIRGGGDLASGVALRLYKAGFRLLITELPQPSVVRRLVSFAEAVYSGRAVVEGVQGRMVQDFRQALTVMEVGQVPVLVDPGAQVLQSFHSNGTDPDLGVLVDARMTKRPPEIGLDSAPLVIGLGPGFVAGANCHAVIETNRGHLLGRVIWEGGPESDTGIPESVAQHQSDRVLRSPAAGALEAFAEIGEHLEPGQPVAAVNGQMVLAPFRGVLRGLVHAGLNVRPGEKIGDVDPRDDPRYCTLVSDKSLAVGGGVLEAILSRPEMRNLLWD